MRSNSSERVTIRLFARSEVGGQALAALHLRRRGRTTSRPLSRPARPPFLIHHLQEAGRYTAIAIGQLDRNPTRSPEAISDALSHLLTVSGFADAAAAADLSPTDPDEE